jgi:hypothetical protein
MDHGLSIKKRQAFLITAKITAITAITNKMWIKLPAPP